MGWAGLAVFGFLGFGVLGAGSRFGRSGLMSGMSVCLRPWLSSGPQGFSGVHVEMYGLHVTV